MSTQESTVYRRPWGLAKTLMCLSVMAFVAIYALNTWPAIQPYLAGVRLPAVATSAPITWTATPGDTQRARPTPLPIQNPGGSYNSPAAADAAVATAIAQQEQRAAPVPNQNNTGDAAPVQYAEKQDTRPAPPPPGQASVSDSPPVDSSFGSKPVGGPVDIQATHQCLHGQVWTDSGCHRPTP